MELYQLRYFAKVAEMEHMTRAAQELNLSEPALSRAIRQLEEELGTKLFERRGRSIVLTESGTLLQTRAGGVLKHVGDVRAELRSVQQERQPVRLVARAAASILPDLLARFYERNPDIAVSVVQNDNNVIRNQEYDLMIGSTLIHPPKYSSVELVEDPFRVWLPPEHPLAAEEAVRLGDLTGQPMIGLAPNRFISVILQQALEQFDVRVRRPIYSDDPLMIRNLVERGMGFAIVPVYTLRAQDKTGIRELPIAESVPCLRLVLSWKKDAYHPEPVRQLRRFIVEYFRTLPQEEEKNAPDRTP